MLTSINAVAPASASDSYVPLSLAESIPAGQSGNLLINVKELDGVTAYDLTGKQLLLTVTDDSGNVIIARQATFFNAAGGTAYFPIDVGDTAGKAGSYTYDVWLTDATITPNGHYQLVSVSSFSIQGVRGTLSQSVTVSPYQVPLAQGPQGLGIGTDVTKFPGSDLGAQIMAADAFIGAAPGYLVIPDGNYLWETHISTTPLRPNRVVKFGSGTITCKGTDPGISTTDAVDNIQPGVNTLTPVAMSGAGWAIKVGDVLTVDAEQVTVTAITSTTFTATFAQAHNGTVTPFAINGYYAGPMMSIQDNTTIYGNGPSTIFDEPDSGVIFATVENTGIEIRDFTVQNIANTPGLNDGSSLPNIGFNNGKKCRIERVEFINTRSLAVSFGGDAALGTKWAEEIEVTRCTFDGVKNITTACVNGDNFRFTHNLWKRPHGLCLDLEPNTTDDRISNFLISDNIFDLRGGVSASGVTAQWQQTCQGKIENNLVIADDYPTATAITGIVVDGTHDVVVQGNVLHGYFGQTPLYVLHATRTKVQGNHLVCACTSTDYLLTIGDTSVDCDISGNTLIIPAGSPGLCGITESPTGTANNSFHDNTIDARGSSTDTVAHLVVSASSSVKWDNLLNGALDGGAGGGGSVVWTNATLLNGYVPLGGNFSPPRYWKDSDGVVHLDGAATGGVSSGVVFTLPAGFRPGNQKDFIGVVDDTASIIVIKAVGDVNGNSGGAVDILFNGISFPAEA